LYLPIISLTTPIHLTAAATWAAGRQTPTSYAGVCLTSRTADSGPHPREAIGAERTFTATKKGYVN
jgi:hypothetical protein